MTADTATLAARALALRLIADRVKAADVENRAALAEALDVGDRKAVALTLDGRRVPVGAVTYANPSTSARITDPNAFLRWVEQNRPDEITAMVRPAYQTAVLAEVKAHGGVIDKQTGELEVVPGVEVVTGAPTLKVVPDGTEDAQLALVEAIRQPGAYQSLLGLPDGGDAA